MDDDTYSFKDYVLYTVLAIIWILIGLLIVEPIMKAFKFEDSPFGGVFGTILWLGIGAGLYHLSIFVYKKINKKN
jgi:hypothetical protein